MKGWPYISKSKFLWGLQCKKLLWYAYNAKNEIPPPDAAQQAVFDQGHEVGALAKTLYPGGIDVCPNTLAFATVLQQSQEAVKMRRPLFEAGFAHDGGFARADILNPVGRNAWDLIEVKSVESKPVDTREVMNTKAQKRAYGKLRDIIERRGGGMVYRRAGYRHGAWVVSLKGRKAVMRAMGCRTFPELDRLYVPDVPNPKTWDDYRNELVPDAERKLLALMV